MRFYTEQHGHYCGIDLHTRTMYLCVVDAAGDMVSGATITLADGGALTKVYYPSHDFQDLTTGTETSISGIFVLPASNFTGITDITAQKAGMTFEPMKADTKGVMCYFVPIQEESE